MPISMVLVVLLVQSWLGHAVEGGGLVYASGPTILSNLSHGGDQPCKFHRHSPQLSGIKALIILE